MSDKVKIRGKEFTVYRSKRKTISIFVERDGSLSARVPHDLHIDDLEATVTQKEYLIHKHLAEYDLLNETRVERQFVNGQSYLYQGRNYRLRIDDTDAYPGHVKLSKGYFVLAKTDIDGAEQLFRSFYKTKLEMKLPDIVDTYSKRLNLLPTSVRVMHLQNRWASCSAAGTLSFHWRCMMAPIDVLHYIVVHELVHLRHPNHSPAFWDEIDRAMPGYRAHHEWLRVNGAGMSL